MKQKTKTKKRILISCAILLILIFGIIAFSVFSITGDVAKSSKIKIAQKFFPKQKNLPILSPIKPEQQIYQEKANEVGVDNGIQGIDNKGYILVNYTKPDDFDNSRASRAVWQVKHGNLPAYNITIPSECRNADPNKIILRIYTNSNNGLGNSTSQPQCYNGKDWENIGNASVGMYTHGYYDSCNITRQGGGNAFDGNWSSFSDRFVYSCLRNGEEIHEAKIMDGDVYTPQPVRYLGGISGPNIYDRVYEESMTWIIPNCKRGGYDYVYGPPCGVDGTGSYCGVNNGSCYWNLQTCDLSVGGLCYMSCTVNSKCDTYRNAFSDLEWGEEFPVFKCSNNMCVECVNNSDCYNRWSPLEWKDISSPVCDSYHFCTEKNCTSNADCNFPVTSGTNWLCNNYTGLCERPECTINSHCLHSLLCYTSENPLENYCG